MCSLYSLRWQQLYCHHRLKKGRKPTPFQNRKGIKRQFKFDKNFENDPIFNFEKLVCHHWQRQVGPVINPPFKLKRRSLSAAYSLTTHSLLKLSLIFYTCNLENTLCHHFWNAYRSAAAHCNQFGHNFWFQPQSWHDHQRNDCCIKSKKWAKILNE